MNPDDKKTDDTIVDISGIDYSTNNIMDNSLSWTGSTYVSFDDMNFDYSFISEANTVAVDGHGMWVTMDKFRFPEYKSVIVGDDPETCLSDKQLDMHSKFPSLEEAWNSYQLLYKLAKGKEPGEDVI